MLDVVTLTARVAAHRPTAHPEAWASTALILGDGGDGPEVLFIRRVTRAGDRWSGDMALPGGKVDPGDADVVAAAAREAFEETRVTVGDPVGRLDDQQARAFTERIATVVFTVDGLPEPVPEPAEVADAMWLPVAALADPAHRTWYRYGGVVPFPSLTIGEHMIWGLTHRIITHFLSVAGIT
ncbi:CoA pyrophosphatase [Euzebya sp.]|uniref:NUDIX hydrolase n=1 Tax=Euzebya sp. TaxID=1971409 RepID=UPI003512C120